MRNIQHYINYKTLTLFITIVLVLFLSGCTEKEQGQAINLGLRTFVSEQVGDNVTAGDILYTDGSNSEWVSPASIGAGYDASWESLSLNVMTPTNTSAGIFVNASSTVDGDFTVIGDGLIQGNATTTGNFTANDTLFVKDGKVGIGTDNPAYTLDVGNKNMRAGIFTIDGGAYFNTDTLRTRRLQFDGGAWIDTSGATGDDDFGFFSSSVERFTINNAGLIGIATTSPWGQLSVEGQGSSPSFVVSDTSNNTDFVVAADGKVGVGTAEPAANLDVSGDIIFYDSTPTTGSTNLTIRQGEGQNSDPMFNLQNAAGSNLMYVGADGFFYTTTGFSNSKVALGWDVGSQIKLTSDSEIQWSNSTSISGSRDLSISRLAESVLSIDTGTVGDSNGILVAGKIGVGTANPGATLHVASTTLGYTPLFASATSGKVAIFDTAFEDGYGLTVATTTYLGADTYISGNATTTASMDALEFCLNGADCVSDWSTLAGAADWDTLTNKPATSTVLALLDSDYRIAGLNATSTLMDHSTTTGVSYATGGFIGNLTGNVVGDVTGALTGNADTASALAANGANCAAGSYPLGVDDAGAVEDCTDATTEINSAITTHAGDNDAHQPLVTLTGQNYLTLSTQEITAGEIEPDDLAASDFGDFSCDGDTCTLDATYVQDGCSDCLNATEIEDIYLLIAGDTSSADYTMTGNWSFQGVVNASSTNMSYASSSQWEGGGLVDCDNAETSKLLWDATSKQFSCGTDQNTGEGGGLADINSSQLGQLVDVSTTTIAIADILMWDGTNWLNQATSSFVMAGEFDGLADTWESGQTARTADDLSDNSIEDLQNVDTTDVAINNILMWNGANWIDQATSSILMDYEIDTFAELQSLVADETLLKGGTLTDTKYCTWNDGEGDIDCNSEGGAGGAFAWTAQSWGMATNTTLGFFNGFLSTASSTIIANFKIEGDTTMDGNATTTGSMDALEFCISGADCISAWTDVDTTLSQEQVEDYAGGLVTGNTETLITVTYQTGDNTLDFVVDNDLSHYSNANSAFLTASPFGATIGPTELESTDFGDFSCNGTNCTLDTDYITEAELDSISELNTQISQTVLYSGGTLTDTQVCVADGTSGGIDCNVAQTYWVQDGCSDCLNATEIEDIYLLVAGDTSSGNYTFAGEMVFNSASSTITQLNTNRATSTDGFVVGADGAANSKKGCMAIQDTDLGGWTYCYTLDGTMTCGTTDCSGAATSTLIIGQ